MSGKVQHTLDSLATAARLDLPSEKLAGLDLEKVRGTLQALSTRTHYTPEEAKRAEGLVEDLKSSLGRAMGSSDLRGADYQATYNLFNALSDVKNILWDIQRGGELGFSRGFVSVQKLTNEIDAQITTMRQYLGGKLAPYLDGGMLKGFSTELELFDGLAAIKKMTLEHMREAKLDSTERLVFEQFLQTLGSAV